MAKRRIYIPGSFNLLVKRSSAGLGLYAGEAIAKDSCVIEYVGKEISEAEQYTNKSRYLFEINSKKTIDGRARSNTARYINHSCRPNCEPIIHKNRVFIFAIKNIKPGEELVYDYGKEYFNEYMKPHGCRCRKCSPNLH